jgi:hypothetical protein
VALYVPAGRRRRNAILGLVGALIVGLVIGGVLGRATAPTVSDRVASIRDSARAVTSRLRATPLEYEKQLSGSSEFRAGGTVVQSLTDAQSSLESALADAVWLSAAQRREIEHPLDELVTAARTKVTAKVYAAMVEAVATKIDAALGSDSSG